MFTASKPTTYCSLLAKDHTAPMINSFRDDYIFYFYYSVNLLFESQDFALGDHEIILAPAKEYSKTLRVTSHVSCSTSCPPMNVYF